jgi:GNAT superfamily N-acetyltransferase
MSVLQLTRHFTDRPFAAEVPGARLRHFEGPSDISNWLEIRRRAFARQKLGVGNWHESDFEREFLGKPWWQPGAMWFAVAEPGESVVATITLARRGEGPTAKPVVHWLAVMPGYRRRGIARLLVATLEAAVWDAGERQIWLETHESWTEAGHFYRTLGYEREQQCR